MIFTQTGHISKGLPVRGSEVESHSLTLVSRVTHTVAVCLRRAFVLGHLHKNLPASSSFSVISQLSKAPGGRRQRAFKWAESFAGIQER